MPSDPHVRNECGCEECVAEGPRCTNIPADGEDICTECEMGIHQAERDEEDA